MEEREEMLLQQLEAEGRQIARCRKTLSDIIDSGRKINCPKLITICKSLNEHIGVFDKINDELSRIEAIGV